MVRKSFKDPVEAQEFFLQQSNPIFWHFSFEDDKYVLERKDNEKVTDEIISIEEIESDFPYVYDLETEDGTFQCGPGSLIVKNTDSIYTKFTIPGQQDLPKIEMMKEIFKVSNECAERITKTFKPPIELEMEKVMFPCLLFSKKRYVNLYWEQPEKPKEIDAKGIQLVRRDNCPLVKKISNPVLEKIMYEQDIEGAQRLVRKYIKDLLENKISIDDLVISKSLKSVYNDTNKLGNKISKPAHWHLAQKIKERDPMTAPRAGDRVPYIFIENNDKNALQKDRVEDPEYAKEHNIKPDVIYYLEKQIESPLVTLFSVLVKDPKTNEIYPLDHRGEISKECKKRIAELLWENSKIRKKNQLKGQTQINDWFNQTGSKRT